MEAAHEWKSIKVRTCPKGKCDVVLSYQGFGNPLNPTVLLVMGLNTQGINWDEAFCQQLVQRGFYVIRFDNRDVGESTKFEHLPCPSMISLLLPRWLWGAAPYTLEDMAEDAVGLLDALGIGKAHWVGVSMGGMISQVAAIRFPRAVLSLTCIMSTTGNPDLPHPAFWVKLGFLKAPKSSSEADLIAFKVYITKYMLTYGCDIDDQYLWERSRVAIRRSTYRKGLTRQTFASVTAQSRDEALGKLTVPALVIHGAKDVLVPVAHGYHLAACIPGSRLVLLEKGGHFLAPADFSLIATEIATVAKHSAPPAKM